MSDYDGCYVKSPGDPTFWAVDDGMRRKVGSIDEMHAIGLRPVKVIRAGQLRQIRIDRKAFRSRKQDPFPAGDEEE